MIKCFFIYLVLVSNLLFGQIQLTNKEKEALIAICNISNSSLTKDSLGKLQSLYPRKFNNFLKQIIASKDVSVNILDPEYLTRPSNDDLMYWYVYRELYYNKLSSDSLKKTQNDVLESVLNNAIDERWLLENYYYRISNNLSLMFNTADLSSIDLNLNNYGLKNETEQAIFFFFIVESCGTRLKVMRMLGKGDAESVINRFPKINGKKYYFYDKFNYPDFNFIGYKELESYNLMHFGNYYDILINHIDFLMQKKNNSEIKNILDNSILSSKELLYYSGNKDKLIKTIENLRERID